MKIVSLKSSKDEGVFVQCVNAKTGRVWDWCRADHVPHAEAMIARLLSLRNDRVMPGHLSWRLSWK